MADSPEFACYTTAIDGEPHALNEPEVRTPKS